MKLINVQAIFDSIDGEENGFGGAGELTTFIRLKGCNLTCGYCDTKYAQGGWPENWMTIEQIIQEVHFPKVTITGGEPLLQEGAVVELCNRLTYHLNNHQYSVVSIETNGTIVPSYFAHDVRYVVDYKLPSSGMEDQMKFSAFSALRYCDVIKFVISNEEDYQCARTLILEHSDWQAKIIFSPTINFIPVVLHPVVLQSSDPKFETEVFKFVDSEWPQQLAEMMIRDRVSAQFGLQLHKILWPGAKKER